MPLPRKFLNDDEELLVELRPHWVFFARRLFMAVVLVGGIIALLVAFSSMPNWLSDALMILAVIPALWFVGRLLRWRSYTLALTTTRIVVRRGVFDRNIVQIRLQRITEISLSQKLWERAIATGRVIIDVQGEDDAVVLDYVRKPAVFQRVVNAQINELIGGGSAEAVPHELRQIDRRNARAMRMGRGRRRDRYDDYDAPDDHDRYDTPPFGTPAAAAPAATAAGTTGPAPANAVTPAPTAGTTGGSEIRDRLVELNDLRERRIISEEEFAAKKAELLDRL